MDIKFWDHILWGNRISDFFAAFLTFSMSFLVVRVIIRSVIRRLKKFVEKTKTEFDDFIVRMLEKILLPFLYLTCAYLGLKVLKFSATWDGSINAIQLAVILFFVARAMILLLSYGFKVFLSRRQDDPTLARSFDGIFGVLKLLIWVLASIVFLDNIGFKVSTMIAGLGIGGIAVAIAAQTLLKDFFSYFSIVFDRPFKLGDFIIIGDYMGTVEYIGIKTTRIRSLGGEQVIFSNTDLTDSRVRNYKLMEKRRVLFRFGVAYQTPLSQMREIPKIIEAIIKETKDTAFDRAHFFSYGDFSLIFEVVYYVLGPDYNKYMDIQQDINFAIKAEFEKRGIDFAYPTQTLYVRNT
ncbi:MAG TPA: mechanosensitive ion channel family protein [Candidatus Omnitrophota bacterium]|nr:mechanosensitive ion channel family protein [Candidatus Omnitrophota bacterium]